MITPRWTSSSLQVFAVATVIIAAKFSLVDEYDNTPAANADRNSLYLAFGLSVLW